MRAGDVIVRRAKVDDAAALLQYIEALRAEKLDTISNETMPTVEQEREWITRTNENGLVLVAVSDSDIVGMLDIRRSDRPSRRHVGGFGMSVARPWRRSGIGRRLLQAAIEEAKAWPGFCRIELEVTPWNVAAIALYQRLGFRHEARKIKAVNFRGQPEDMLLMALTW